MQEKRGGGGVWLWCVGGCGGLRGMQTVGVAEKDAEKDKERLRE